MMTRRAVLATLPTTTALASSAQTSGNVRRPDLLRISKNARHLTHQDGSAFFWLGDTAWELFHRLGRDDARFYLENRAAKGFSVIQAVALGELDGLREPNANGDLPLTDNDPARPNEAYFRHVDFIVKTALENGLYIGLLPTWGDKVVQEWGKGPVVFNETNARIYGKFLGSRYRDTPNIIWILGGDRTPSGFEQLWRNMAQGIAEGDQGRHVMTYHPAANFDSWHSSSQWFHNEEWLDFNMIQTFAHWKQVYYAILNDYRRTPAKPVIMGEPRYEGDDEKKASYDNTVISYTDLRKQAYWSMLAGAAGYTYGRHHMWQMDDKWKASLDSPVAWQMKTFRKIMTSRPWWTFSPDQSVFETVEHRQIRDFANAIPPTPTLNAAARSEKGDCVMVYLSNPKPVSLLMDKVAAKRVRATWINPVTGDETAAGEFAATGTREFTPPPATEDAVLFLDAVR